VLVHVRSNIGVEADGWGTIPPSKEEAFKATRVFQHGSLVSILACFSADARANLRSCAKSGAGGMWGARRRNVSGTRRSQVWPSVISCSFRVFQLPYLSKRRMILLEVGRQEPQRRGRQLTRHFRELSDGGNSPCRSWMLISCGADVVFWCPLRLQVHAWSILCPIPIRDQRADHGLQNVPVDQ
jgi:hypothetical protein